MLFFSSEELDTLVTPLAGKNFGRQQPIITGILIILLLWWKEALRLSCRLLGFLPPTRRESQMVRQVPQRDRR